MPGLIVLSQWFRITGRMKNIDIPPTSMKKKEDKITQFAFA
jgi:hypothetical protein